MARTKRTKLTWQQYLANTRITRSSRTDAAFGRRPVTTATQLRWRGQDRLLFGTRIINGPYTGRLLSSLTLDQIQHVLTKATHKADHDEIKQHLQRIQGPQPGAPVDAETLHSGGPSTQQDHGQASSPYDLAHACCECDEHKGINAAAETPPGNANGQ